MAISVTDSSVVNLPESDGVSSSVHDEPLTSLVSWDGVSDSELVIVTSHVVGEVDSSVTSHSRSDLEWSVAVPLVISSVTHFGVVPESTPLVSAISPLDVVPTVDLVSNHMGALASDVSNGAMGSSEPSQLLIVITSVVVSGGNVSVDAEVVWSLMRNNLVSPVICSDSLSSGIEGPHLSSIPWVEVVNSNE